MFAGNSFMKLWKMDSRLELKYYAKRCHQSLHASEKCVAWQTKRANWTNGRKVSICIICTIACAFLSETSIIFLDWTKQQRPFTVENMSGIDIFVESVGLITSMKRIITLLLSKWDWIGASVRKIHTHKISFILIHRHAYFPWRNTFVR